MSNSLPAPHSRLMSLVVLFGVSYIAASLATAAVAQQSAEKAEVKANATNRPILSFEMGDGGVPLVLMNFPDVPGATFKAWCFESMLVMEGKPTFREDGSMVFVHRNQNDSAMLIETTVTPTPGRVAFVARAFVDRIKKPEGNVGRGLPYLNVCFQERKAKNFGADGDPYPELIKRHFVFTKKGQTFLLDTDRRPIPGKPADHEHNNPPWVQIYTPIWRPVANRKSWSGYSRDRYVYPIIGTVSRDGRYLVAIANNGQCGDGDGVCNAWHDCLHANPSWSPIEATTGEEKRWRLNVYCMKNDPDTLVERVKTDFAEVRKLSDHLPREVDASRASSDPARASQQPAPASRDDATLPYQDLLKHRSGFARKVTGGAGGEVVVLDTLDIATFQQALADDTPRWIRFKPGLKGAIELNGNLHIGSNKTIDGRGAEITITSPDDCDGVLFWGKDKDWNDVDERRNLIVHNIKIINVGKGDNCGQGLGIAYGAQDVWVDHVTFSGNGDESLSMGKGATNLTVSWCRFVDTDKAILLSWGSSEEDARLDPAMKVTIHHSYFLRVNGRSPALRFGKVHYFNNYLKHWSWSGVAATMGGEIFSQNNIYGGGRWDNSPPALKTDANKWSPKPGFIKTVNDRFQDAKGIDGKGPGINRGKVFEPRKHYEYEAEAPSDRLQNRLEEYSGWSSSPKWPIGKSNRQ